jgi:uncharacterized membrane protein
MEGNFLLLKMISLLPFGTALLSQKLFKEAT